MEWFKLRKRPMSYAVLLILAAFLATSQLLVYLVVYVAAREESGVTPEARQALLNSLVLPQALPTLFANVQNLGSIMLIILTTVSFGGEFGWGTVRLLLGRGEGRAQFIVGKVLALAGWTFLLLVVGLLTGVADSILVTLLEGRGLSGALAGVALGSLPAMAARTYYTMVIYLLLATFATVVTRSTAAGMAISLVYYFVEGAVGDILQLLKVGDLQRLLQVLIGVNVRGLLAANGPGGGRAGLPSPVQATLVIALYGLAFLLLSIVLMRRRDIQAGGGQ
jgi:ABC-type transport system involved in multi-copper enzyme maturation permease subunit